MLPTLVLGRIMVAAGSAKMRVEAVFWLLRESEELLARGIFAFNKSEPFQKVFQIQYQRIIKRFFQKKCETRFRPIKMKGLPQREK